MDLSYTSFFSFCLLIFVVSLKKNMLKSNIKFTIQPYSQAPSSSEDFLTNTLEELANAVTDIFERGSCEASYEELYQAVFDLCCYKLNSEAYNALSKQCEEHIANIFNNLAIQSTAPLEFIPHLHQAWKLYGNQMQTIRSIYLYLDKSITHNQQNLQDMGLQLFRQQLQKYPEIEQKTLQASVRLIETERQGMLQALALEPGAGEEKNLIKEEDTMDKETIEAEIKVDRGLLKDVITMFSNVNLYDRSFLPLLLQTSRTFFQTVSNQLISSLSVSQYLIRVRDILKAEEQRCETYLGASSAAALLPVVERELISTHLSVILKEGLGPFLTQHSLPDLALLYQLCARAGELSKLSDAFRLHLAHVGTTLTTTPEQDSSMINSLLALKTKSEQVITEAFTGDQSFRRVMDLAFNDSVNSRAHRPAELLARHLDEKLKIGSRTPADELQSYLDQVRIYIYMYYYYHVFIIDLDLTYIYEPSISLIYHTHGNRFFFLYVLFRV